MNHYVYEITNNINGMKYIGKRSCHCEIEKDNYMGGGTVLKKAKKEFGIQNFTKKILVIADDDMVLDLESYYIEKRNAIESDMYYNQIYEGDISHMFKHNDGDKQALARNRISEKNKGANAEENSNVAKKVVCLNKEKVYASITEASNETGLPESTISRACKSRFVVGIAGEDQETSKGLRWMYYDKYLKMIEGDSLENLLPVSNPDDFKLTIICLNTKEGFDTIEEASTKYNAQDIRKACIFGIISGVHPITGEGIKWMCYARYK